MPVILRNNSNSVEIDINPVTRYSVSKGGYDVIYEDSGSTPVPMVFIVFRAKNLLVNNTIGIDWRDAYIMPGETWFTSAENLRDTLLEWNVPQVDVVADTVDGTELYSSSVTGNEIAASVDTSGYVSMVVQLSGRWKGNIYFEESNDDQVWFPVLVYSANEPSAADFIQANGIYHIKAGALYIRYRTDNFSGTLSLVMIGRTAARKDTADILSLAMDKVQGIPLQVQLPKDIKQDREGAIILSDMDGPYVWNSKDANSPFIIDCKGFQSVLVHKITAGVVTPTVSNDGTTWSATLAVPVSSTSPGSTIVTAAGMYVMPVVGRFLRLVGPASIVQCYIYLSQAPFNVLLNTAVNIAQYGGTAVVTGGVLGLVGVGGNIAPAAAPTANPVPVGTIDDNRTGLTRRLLSDTEGHPIITVNSQKLVNDINYLPTYKIVLPVMNLDRDEQGNRPIDLLAALLLELKILNQQIYELPRLIDEGKVSPDAPESFRKESSIFRE
jgi:hypothetical protein